MCNNSSHGVKPRSFGSSMLVHTNDATHVLDVRYLVAAKLAVSGAANVYDLRIESSRGEGHTETITLSGTDKEALRRVHLDIINEWNRVKAATLSVDKSATGVILT